MRISKLYVFLCFADFEKLTKACKKRPLDQKYLNVRKIRKCRSVCVSGLDDTITEDAIQNFFENKRHSGGGPISDIDLQTDIGICIIQFENSRGIY